MGADDFLVAHAAVEFRKALDSAIDPEPLTGAESKLKASELDPAGEAETMLGVDAIDGLPVLRYWRGTWLRWKDGSYGEIVPAEIRARMVRFLNQHYWKLSQRITGDALDQLKAQAMLWGSIEAPAWIDGDTSGRPMKCSPRKTPGAFAHICRRRQLHHRIDAPVLHHGGLGLLFRGRCSAAGKVARVPRRIVGRRY